MMSRSLTLSHNEILPLNFVPVLKPKDTTELPSPFFLKYKAPFEENEDDFTLDSSFEEAQSKKKHIKRSKTYKPSNRKYSILTTLLKKK